MSGSGAPDRELADWQDQWRSAGPAGPPSAAEVRRSVMRRSRRLRLWWWAETVAAVAALVLISWAGVVLPSTLDRVAMAALAGIVAGAWLYGAHVWRGRWFPAAETTRAYLDLRHQHLERLRRAVRAGWIVLALYLLVYVPWIAHRLGQAGTSALLAGYGLLLEFVLPYAIVLPLVSRRIERERRELGAMLRELGEP